MNCCRCDEPLDERETRAALAFGWEICDHCFAIEMISDDYPDD